MGAIVAVPLTLTTAILSYAPSEAVVWAKWIISYGCIRLSRYLTKGRFDFYDVHAEHDPIKANFIVPQEEIDLESPLEEGQLHKTADEVFFHGVNSKSEYLVTKIMRYPNNAASAWIFLQLSNGKLYQLKKTANYQQSSCEKKVFSCGGLQLHYITPMRAWRIFYNGLLKETDHDGTNEKMVYVKFAFIWRASSDVFDFTSDISASALAKGMSETKWLNFRPPIEEFSKVLNLYSQSGTISGTLSVDGTDELSMYLFGERIRYIGDFSILNEIEFYHLFGQVYRNGSVVHLFRISMPNIVKDLTHGFVVTPTGVIDIVTDATFDLRNIKEERSGYDEIIKFHGKNNLYILRGKPDQKANTIYSTQNPVAHEAMDNIRFELNNNEGSGFIIEGKIFVPSNTSDDQSKPPTSLKSETHSAKPLVTSFTEKVCQDPSLTGGKGSSLGMLTELSKDLKNFIVPNGVVVTTAAYELFITEEVKNEIQLLEDVLYERTAGDVQQTSQRVMEEVVKSNIPDQVLHSIVTSLQKVFPDKDILKFAVRSSATGEDTEQMSAAGQMDTFLGVSGINQILSAIKKCWASQFSHIAVQYKRQNGQILNSPMAVVIQKMIPCDVAGVLFTCDPLTGNPTVMNITANYGLGESVVSASEEPDTIEIARDIDDQLSIKNKTIGVKDHRIVLQDEAGTNVEDVSEEEKQTCCLSDEMALRLADLAVKIEKCYRSHRDIEWGFWKSNLYIFQSRPVTSGFGETDYEIDHEMDAHLRIEDEFFTVANVGEVMPGAQSPLNLDVLFKFMRLSFLRNTGSNWSTDIKAAYYSKGMISMYNRAMFHLCDFYEKRFSDEQMMKIASIGTFGHVLEVSDFIHIVDDRFGKPKTDALTSLKELLQLRRLLFGYEKYFKKAARKYENYRIPTENYNTSQELFDALLHACTEITDTMTVHIKNSEASSIWNVFILNALIKYRGEINADVYRDFSELMRISSEVVSADVPAAIEELASYIEKEIQPEDFKSKSVKDILEWLDRSETMAGAKYREFLTKHGHRCLREFDMRTKPWREDRNSLINLLKSLVGKPEKVSNKKKSFEEKLSSLSLSLGFANKLFLKFLISRGQYAVQQRELSKSLLIKTIDAWRKAYTSLAKLMLSEGRIPDEDLLFFMNLNEIKELLNTRSPKIISRARHRRRRYPILDKYIFPEIMKGFPKPIDMESDVEISDEENFSMKGSPVSAGIAKAYVRVALTLKEAESLKPGEILVTYSTDIGWTPYFPMLAGVVTEIGGLISHGAVVSREYGLPCIAGIHGATRQFKTGDYVQLDGNKGILQRLKKVEIAETSL
ncbi:rifampicin phosphotransferase-like isoform X2 [Parasteatoda tepidariorum]|uniref:rifampicin phosphotransferase-like isoform X2 n=1 Tax=Parasteatoda tepidariorum TaxID=114398 RepID=UPI001C724BD5|nr:putative phosphoenolpyruvate synthase isoform X1 [Parasteatoda tepidariorum]